MIMTKNNILLFVISSMGLVLFAPIYCLMPTVTGYITQNNPKLNLSAHELIKKIPFINILLNPKLIHHKDAQPTVTTQDQSSEASEQELLPTTDSLTLKQILAITTQQLSQCDHTILLQLHKIIIKYRSTITPDSLSEDLIPEDALPKDVTLSHQKLVYNTVQKILRELQLTIEYMLQEPPKNSQTTPSATTDQPVSQEQPLLTIPQTATDLQQKPSYTVYTPDKPLLTKPVTKQPAPLLKTTPTILPSSPKKSLPNNQPAIAPQPYRLVYQPSPVFYPRQNQQPYNNSQLIQQNNPAHDYQIPNTINNNTVPQQSISPLYSTVPQQNNQPILQPLNNNHSPTTFPTQNMNTTTPKPSQPYRPMPIPNKSTTIAATTTCPTIPLVNQSSTTSNKTLNCKRISHLQDTLLQEEETPVPPMGAEKIIWYIIASLSVLFMIGILFIKSIFA
jgi:hypothetical protein